MKKTITKTKRLLTLFLAFVSFATIAQTNTIEKTKQPKQDEAGTALKKWFDEGEIIIEGTSVDWMPITFVNLLGQKEGGLCNKVKINRVIKGILNTGYINIKTPGHSICGNCQELPVEKRANPEGIPGGYIYYSPTTAFLIRIKKTDIQTDGFIVENAGIYTEVGRTKLVYDNNENTNDNAVNLYQMLEKYCNVKADLKEIQKQQDKRQAVQDSLDLLYIIKNSKLTEAQKKVNEERKARVEELRNRNKTKRDSIKSNEELKKKIKVKTNSNRTSNVTGCSELYFSEYLDGQGNNKVIEVYNPTTSSISLSNYSILIYHGSSYTPTTIALTGTISALSTHVISKPNATSAILAHTNQTSNNLNFNGDEIIVLSKATIDIDKIGVIGTAIGSSGWTLTPTGSTVNADLRRKFSIGVGDTVWSNCKAEWDVFSRDSISDLGHHSNICGVDPDLNITLANAVVVGNNFEFDIMVTSNAPTYLNSFALDITYNPSAFGTNIFTNGNVNVTLGSNFSPSTYANPNTLLFDSGLDTLSFSFWADFSASSWNRYLVPVSPPQQLMHVSIVIANCNQNANIQMINQTNDAMFDNYVANANDNPNTATTYSYTNVTYGSGLSYSIPPCATNPQITGFTGGLTPNSVVAGAYYGTSGGGESLLTINGSGFGGLIGNIYMANAVNNSAPFYIPLDKYDIQTWSPTQVTLLVPSILFPVGSATATPAYYPGTGNIYVKAKGATDSTSSLSQVQIPYALKNIAFGSASKERVPFAYRHTTDSTGTADTSAYNFRFDIATVTNNANQNCRPLLKQAIHDWQCNLPIRYRIGKDTTITTSAPDGISYINFKSGIGADTLSNPNFAAETRVSVNPCSGYHYATEADISFLSLINWYYVNPNYVPIGSGNDTLPPSTQADFFTTALHEVGHASLLLHVNQTSDLMYFKIPTSGAGPYISSDDNAGGVDNITWSKTLTFGACPFNAFSIPAGGAVCTNPTNGIKEIIGNSTFEISVYPNPAEDFLNVTFVKEKVSSNTIKLINIIGQPVFYRNIGTNEGAREVINLKSLAKGVYMLIITDNANTVYKKIIIE
jgi:hypothetical protein